MQAQIAQRREDTRALRESVPASRPLARRFSSRTSLDRLTPSGHLPCAPGAARPCPPRSRPSAHPSQHQQRRPKSRRSRARGPRSSEQSLNWTTWARRRTRRRKGAVSSSGRGSSARGARLRCWACWMGYEGPLRTRARTHEGGVSRAVGRVARGSQGSGARAPAGGADVGVDLEAHVDQSSQALPTSRSPPRLCNAPPLKPLTSPSPAKAGKSRGGPLDARRAGRCREPARSRLLLVVLGLGLVGDVGVGEGEGVLGRGDDAHEAAADVLLEVLLGEVLDVWRGAGERRGRQSSGRVGTRRGQGTRTALGEGDRRGDGELGRLTLERDELAELAGLAVDLDAVVEVLLELGGWRRGERRARWVNQGSQGAAREGRGQDAPSKIESATGLE